MPRKFPLVMDWEEDDDEQDFEWKEEDEEEIPGEGSTLSRINRVATVIFLGLIALGVIYFVIRLVAALSNYFG
jgi:hypothetical protein